MLEMLTALLGNNNGPLMRLIGANATARASMYLYSNEADVDALVEALGDVSSIF